MSEPLPERALQKLIAEGLLQPPYFCSLLGFGREIGERGLAELREVLGSVLELSVDLGVFETGTILDDEAHRTGATTQSPPAVQLTK